MAAYWPNLRIVSRQSDPFADRVEAGRLLAAELHSFTGIDALVLGIPRGGVVVAAAAAHILSAELDMEICRKIGAPDNPEYAIGAVAETGESVLNRQVLDELGIDVEELASAQERAMAEIRRQCAFFRPARPRAGRTNRPVIVMDDGIATGYTLEAALRSVRHDRPSYLVAAVPVAAESSLPRLAAFADEILCLRSPSRFFAVGEFYRHFDQVSDQEAVDLLEIYGGKLKNEQASA